MMNLNTPGKKLFFRTGIILGGLLIIALSYWEIKTAIDNYKMDQYTKQTELVRKYESRIDSVNTINYMYALQSDSLKKQVIEERNKKHIVYIETIKKEEEIKSSTASESAKAIDTLTGQVPTWTIKNDSVSNDTIIDYKFTKPGITKLRLTINDLSKYKTLYRIDEEIINKQASDLNIQSIMLSNDKIAIGDGKKALLVSSALNDKLIKQLTKAQKGAHRWPIWLGAGFLGGIGLCLSVQ